MDYGIKISQVGTSVKSNQLLFDSTKESIKLFKNNITTIYSNGGSATYIFNHKLGYVPIVMVFYAWRAVSAPFLREAGNSYFQFEEENGNLGYSVNKNSLTITGYDTTVYDPTDPENPAARRFWTVKWFIFSDKLRD
jgi:hypothetical protein